METHMRMKNDVEEEREEGAGGGAGGVELESMQMTRASQPGMQWRVGKLGLGSVSLSRTEGTRQRCAYVL